MRRSHLVVLVAVGLLLGGCSSGPEDDSDATSSAPAPSSTSSSSSSGAPSSTESSPPAASSPPGGSRTGRLVSTSGVIGFPGLTCLAFQASDGRRYDLRGPAVTPRVRALARGGQPMRSNLSDRPTSGPVRQTRITVRGHTLPGAASTCGATALWADELTTGDPV